MWWRLGEGYLVIVDTAAQLVECGQNPEDVLFAGGMVLHFGELLDDIIIALVDERRCEYGFVVCVVAFMFAVRIKLDFEGDFGRLFSRCQGGFNELVVAASRKGCENVGDIAST